MRCPLFTKVQTKLYRTRFLKKFIVSEFLTCQLSILRAGIGLGTPPGKVKEGSDEVGAMDTFVSQVKIFHHAEYKENCSGCNFP